MDMLFKKARRFTGISWRHPLVSQLLKTFDPLDAAVRARKGLRHLPRYTIRIRSTGLSGEFGGKKFLDVGNYFAGFLRDEIGLAPDQKVLEIGCGCGRVAMGLAKELDDGNYTGADIDAISLQACIENELLSQKRFRFILMDVENGVYNPTGKVSAGEYSFPFPDNAFNVICLFSVFTHMMPESVENYFKEASWLLAPSGYLVLSTFIMDYGHEGNDISFPVDCGEYRILNVDIPEKAVGYDLAFFDVLADRYMLVRQRDPLFGQWRDNPNIVAATQASQDILIYQKVE